MRRIETVIEGYLSLGSQESVREGRETSGEHYYRAGGSVAVHEIPRNPSRKMTPALEHRSRMHPRRAGCPQDQSDHVLRVFWPRGTRLRGSGFLTGALGRLERLEVGIDRLRDRSPLLKVLGFLPEIVYLGAIRITGHPVQSVQR